MTEQILEKLFDSPIKIKLLKFFLRNYGGEFDVKEVAERLRVNPRLLASHIKKLVDIGFLISKTASAKVFKKKNKKTASRKSFSANPKFEFFQELKSLVLKSVPASKEKMLVNLKNLGRIKLALISGMFINTENSRTDLLLVCNNIKERKLSSYLKNLEAEVGKEIEYVVLTAEEFNYRRGMFDKFLRDVLEGPHEMLINKLKL